MNACPELLIFELFSLNAVKELFFQGCFCNQLCLLSINYFRWTAEPRSLFLLDSHGNLRLSASIRAEPRSLSCWTHMGIFGPQLAPWRNHVLCLVVLTWESSALRQYQGFVRSLSSLHNNLILLHSDALVACKNDKYCTRSC